MGNIINSKFFISYSHLDEGVADHLKQTLKRWKIQCFIDKVIDFDEDFRDRITRELKTATHLIVIISENSLLSQWVAFEIGFAEGYGIKIIPLIISPCQVPTYLRPHKYLTIKTEIDKIQLIELFIQIGLFDDGFVSKDLMRDYPKRFPNEVFAEEVLKQPIQLVSTGGKIQIQINRNDVDYILISNKGKKYFCDKYIKDEQAAKNLDIKIHDFQINPLNGTKMIIPTDQYPIRWVSGGTLSIVKYNNNEWIPLFFRDIDPIGWNVSLGGSERDFTEDNENRACHSLNQDLNNPLNVIIREFLEETLVINKSPEKNEPINIMRFYWDGTVNIEKQREKADRFSRRHVKLRQDNDFLNILNDTKTSDELIFSNFGIPTDFVTTKTILKIIDGEANKTPERNILAAINILDLGIEIVKIVKYEIKDNYYFLDGEILKNNDDSEELVRMPFVLISLDYLKEKIYGTDISTIFAAGLQASFIMDGVINPDKVILFEWDIKQRIEISKRNTINNKKTDMLKEWDKKNFGGKYFYDQNYKIIKTKLPLIFTPSTVKLLQYYFAL
jgi:hypothetical protein